MSTAIRSSATTCLSHCLRTLARSYNDPDTQLDRNDEAKLQMLENYLQSLEHAVEDETPIQAERDEQKLPARAEDVDKFMQTLADEAAALKGP